MVCVCLSSISIASTEDPFWLISFIDKRIQQKIVVGIVAGANDLMTKRTERASRPRTGQKDLQEEEGLSKEALRGSSVCHYHHFTGHCVQSTYRMDRYVITPYSIEKAESTRLPLR